jgi:primosomal protein N' (replication factor Y)
MPAIMERMDGRSRMYLVLLADNRADLHGQIDRWLPLIRQTRLARKIRWSVDVDPQEL